MGTYAYSAARAPGAKPDRYATQEGDANGVVRGQYAYLDPNYQWQQVAYLADANGFHVDASNLPIANVDTPAVAAAKAQHSALYGQIALSHAQGIEHPIVPAVVPQDTAAVSAARAQHEALFGHLAQVNSQAPIEVVRQVPVETAAVSEQRLKFADQFAAIAQEHARIAEEHALLAEQEERERLAAEGELA